MSNSFSANSLPAFPILFLSSLFNISFSIVSAKDLTFLTSHKSPVWFGSIASLHPGTSVVTTALPHAAAYIRTFGKPSLYDGRTTMFEFENTLDIPLLKP